MQKDGDGERWEGKMGKAGEDEEGEKMNKVKGR